MPQNEMNQDNTFGSFNPNIETLGFPNEEVAGAAPKGFVATENGDLEETAQSKLWRNVYIETIKRGGNIANAAAVADLAVDDFMNTTKVQ